MSNTPFTNPARVVMKPTTNPGSCVHELKARRIKMALVAEDPPISHNIHATG